MQNSKVSICIPYHQTPGTASYLWRALRSLERQTYKNYEIILTSDGAFARNHNAAITKATGDIIQMLQMDDFFSDSESLQRIVDAFEDPETSWVISASLHSREGDVGWPHLPEWTDDIYTGNNRLGSVSTLAMRKDKALFFEEPLTWTVDCDLYYRLFLRYGKPKLLLQPNVVIDTRTSRLSSTLSDELKADEINYLIKKYGN